MLHRCSVGPLLMLSVAATGVASAECVANAYRTGSRIPVYIVESVQQLTDRWESYEQQYPATGRLSDAARYYEFRPISEQCLVDVASDDERVVSEQLIIQQPCSDFSAGDRIRLVVWHYCVENFGRDPDFYSTLPYRHANVTTDTHFQ